MALRSVTVAYFLWNKRTQSLTTHQKCSFACSGITFDDFIRRAPFCCCPVPIPPGQCETKSGPHPVSRSDLSRNQPSARQPRHTNPSVLGCDPQLSFGRTARNSNNQNP